jgi:hypothetical protein
MDRQHDDDEREATIPAAKRDGRDGVDPETLPGEFADDLRVNRFTTPPEPKSGDTT